MRKAPGAKHPAIISLWLAVALTATLTSQTPARTRSQAASDPALQRLERAGLLDAEWRETDNGRRGRFYSLTRAGRKQLAVETSEWDRKATAINRLLRAES